MAKNKKPASKPAAKPAPKKAPAAGKSAPAKPAEEAKSAALKAARDDLRNRILGRKASKPIAFSLDEVREIAKTNAGKPAPAATAAAKAGKPAARTPGAARPLEGPPTSTKPSHIKAASLVDVLGFNPKKAQKPFDTDPEKVPEKFRRYFKLLIDLRNHLLGQLDQHTEETLKRSTKEDTGDLSSYGQHMADAGTDTFDRDFALSMVANEQEALSEIDAAIQRIHDGTYGVCEVTAKPISKERLLAVPFTRYSAEAQKEIERNRYRARTQAGLFGELGEEGAKLSDTESGDE